MAEAYTILTLSPGSTSTKVAVFKGDQEVFKSNIKHTAEELAKYPQAVDQREWQGVHS